MSLEQELYHLELRTLDNTVRSNPELMDQLLSDNFFEFGASGKEWNRVEVLSTLALEGALFEVELRDVKVRRLGEQHALLTYKLMARRDGATNNSIRSSVWERTERGWRMVFHQGTPRP